MAADVQHLRQHIKIYIAVFVTLGLLTLVTVWASYLPINLQGHVTVALLIASVKAGLVAAFFMHLSSEKPLIYRVLIFTAIFVLGLFALTLMAYFDPITVKHS
jgi:cytochrome c oxidase subunit 4